MQGWVAVCIEAPMHMWHIGHKPTSREVFNPHTHVTKGDLVLIHMEVSEDDAMGLDIAKVVDKYNIVDGELPRNMYVDRNVV